MNEESHSFNQEEQPQKNHEADASRLPVAMGGLLSTLPPLPEEVWQTRSDATTWAVVRSWWERHGLADRFGAQAESVGATLLGLIETSRRARDPAAFFWKSRSTPASYLEGNGRKWLKRVASSQPKTDPIVEATARERAKRREERAAASVT